MHSRLRPPDHLVPAVDAGGEALVAAERGQRLHHAILPYEPTTDMAGHAGEERRATPLFPQWVEVGSLGDAYDRALVVGPGPNHAAVARWTVRPPERAEVAYRSVAPQGRMPGVVPGQVGEARHPAAIVDRRAPARHSTERRGGLGDRVLRVRRRLGERLERLGDLCLVATAGHAGDQDRPCDETHRTVLGCESVGSPARCAGAHVLIA